MSSTVVDLSGRIILIQSRYRPVTSVTIGGTNTCAQLIELNTSGPLELVGPILKTDE